MGLIRRRVVLSAIVGLLVLGGSVAAVSAQTGGRGEPATDEPGGPSLGAGRVLVPPRPRRSRGPRWSPLGVRGRRRQVRGAERPAGARGEARPDGRPSWAPIRGSSRSGRGTGLDSRRLRMWDERRRRPRRPAVGLQRPQHFSPARRRWRQRARLAPLSAGHATDGRATHGQSTFATGIGHVSSGGRGRRSRGGSGTRRATGALSRT